MTSRNGQLINVDAELGVLSLQPAFVEGIERTGRRFSSLETAYRHIFRRNLEWGILLWSDVPVRISYRDDLPAMVDILLELLGLVATEEHAERTFNIETPHLETRWSVELSGESVDMQARWLRVQGNYEAALNQAVMISMPREAFLSEWKLLLEQLVKAFTDSGAKLTRKKARERFETLVELESAIPARGRFYRYETRRSENGY